MHTTPCTTCQHPTVPDREWRKLPRPRTVRPRTGAGECRTCYRNGSRPTGPRGPQLPREVVLEEWDWLHTTGELTRHDSVTDRVRKAAPRIGMSGAALEKALHRAGRLERPNPTPLRRDSAGSNGCLQCRKSLTQRTEARGHVRMLAGRLSRDPDSRILARALEDAREHLAGVDAMLDAHADECTNATDLVAA